MSRSRILAEALLRDRAEVIARKPVRKSTVKANSEPGFDPFAITRWRVIAGGDPGYLVKTPMRRGPVGWFIPCRACAVEFESQGRSYCPTYMALPAEERRDHEPVKRVGRPCARPGCGERLSQPARADALHCSAACRPEMSQLEAQETQQNQGPKSFLVGPADFPINIVGGYRWPGAKPNPLGRVRVRPWVERAW